MKRFTPKQEADWLLEQERKHESANKVKNILKKAGYTEHLSLYGIVTRQSRNIHKYRRIEVISNETFTETDVSLIYRFFQNIKPDHYYTIWIYDQKPKELLFIGGWN